MAGGNSQHPLDIVIDDTLKKDLLFYHKGIRRAFTSLYRVLKPNRWVSIVFHNSSNAVWQSIQDGLFAAGFVVADVRTLDKQQETIKQSQQGVVKQDLVISAYKPPVNVEERCVLRGRLSATCGSSLQITWGSYLYLLRGRGMAP